MIKLFQDPVADTIAVCNNLYPNLGKITIDFAMAPTKGPNKRFGWTEFADDGTLIATGVNANAPYRVIPELVAHEIAHVVAEKIKPNNEDDHGPTWQSVFTLIHKTYLETLDQRETARTNKAH